MTGSSTAVPQTCDKDIVLTTIPKRVCIYDASESFSDVSSFGTPWRRFKAWIKARFLWSTWAVGSRFYKAIGRFDLIIPATSWAHAADILLQASLAGPFDEIQFWGHGSPGNVFINRVPLSRAALLPTHDLHVVLETLRDVTHPRSILWWRSCSVFAGMRGHEFAENVADFVDCRHAGHTYIVSYPWQSGLHSVRRYENAHWLLEEGEDDKGRTGKKWSGPLAPNTIYAHNPNLPEGW